MPAELAIGLASLIFKKPLEDLYNHSTSAGKRHLNRFLDSQAIHELKAKISEVDNVRTIATRGTSSLRSIYYPSRIKTSTGSAAIRSISDLDNSHDSHIVINGTVGQGKSVFLKFLCLTEIEKNETLPIFIELRRINQEVKLIDLIKDQISYLQISRRIDDSFVDLALRIRAVSLFLDGYDEIPSAYAQRTSNEIKSIASRFDKLKILITSRPTDISQHLDQLTGFNHLQLQPLTSVDFPPFLEKIGVNRDIRTTLLGAIENSPSEIRAILTTPLMLTLLVSSCGGRSVLPDTLSDFYKVLFSVMVSTHDETKPGYIREKATGLSSSQLEGLFKTFCYASKNFETTTLAPPQFEIAAREAIRLKQSTCTPEQFKSDIINVVCLMAKDGINTSFIHKSIQEYFTAAFISELDNDMASEEIYKIIQSNLWYSWKQELAFLQEIDKNRCIRYFHIPSITKILELFGYDAKSRDGASKKSIDDAARHYELRIENVDNRIQQLVPMNVINKLGYTEYFFAPFKGIDSIFKDFNIRESSLIDQLRPSAKAREALYERIRSNLKVLAIQLQSHEAFLAQGRADLMSLIGLHSHKLA